MHIYEETGQWPHRHRRTCRYKGDSCCKASQGGNRTCSSTRSWRRLAARLGLSLPVLPLRCHNVRMSLGITKVAGTDVSTSYARVHQSWLRSLVGYMARGLKLMVSPRRLKLRACRWTSRRSEPLTYSYPARALRMRETALGGVWIQPQRPASPIRHCHAREEETANSKPLRGELACNGTGG